MVGHVWKESTSTNAFVLQEGLGAAVSSRPRLVRSRVWLGEDVPLLSKGDPGHGPPESGLFLPVSHPWILWFPEAITEEGV